MISTKNNDSDNRDIVINDAFILDLIRQNDGNETELPPDVQDLFLQACGDFADQLRRMHGMKPLDRKKRRNFAYTGRGVLDMNAIFERTLNLGIKSLAESRKVRVNPERPHIALILDVSLSMTSRCIKRAAMMLALGFIELFGQNFAQSFGYGEVSSKPCLFIDNMDNTECKNKIVKGKYWSGTEFVPTFNLMEESGFFGKRGTKYIFVITDGAPEVYHGAIRFNVPITQSGATMNGNALGEECKDLGEYLGNRWVKGNTIEYFWIQISTEKNMLDFVSQFDYLAPHEEVSFLNDQQYNEYVRDHPSKISNYYARFKQQYEPWARFMLAEWQNGNMFYMNINDMLEKDGIHEMMDYFMIKFNKRLKLN